MILLSQRDAVSGAASRLVAGRTAGFVASFAIPMVLARVFGLAEFGTYKQLFLIYATLYGLAQVGMAESLYYFVPRNPDQAGRRITNALVTLILIGLTAWALLSLGRGTIAAWMSNPALEAHLPLLGLFLALTLPATILEIVMVSRNEHTAAAWVYAASDIIRTLLLVVPAMALWGLRGVLIGAIACAALRMAAMLIYLWRALGHDLRIDATLWSGQLAYALPFALAVGVEVVQANLHQYFVASRFDAATFAIYAVGCLQIPLIDVISSSTANVMMVKMAQPEEGAQQHSALALWHETTCRLATLMFPLAVLLVLTAPAIIVLLFTDNYLASVPIFMVWSLTILPSAFAVDAVLRVYARTRFLLVMNLVRLLLVALLTGWCLSTFGLAGAVVVTLLATVVLKAAGVAAIARIMKVGIGEVLPWKKLAAITAWACLSAGPALWVSRAAWPPLAMVANTAAVYAATLALIWLVATRWQSARTPERLGSYAID
jgi:O-antigen/teichoic acid export membrane protein